MTRPERALFAFLSCPLLWMSYGDAFIYRRVTDFLWEKITVERYFQVESWGYVSPEALGVWQVLWYFKKNIWGTAEPKTYFAQSAISLSFSKTVCILGKFNLCTLESFNPHSSKHCKVNTRSGFKKSLEFFDKQFFPLNSKVKFCQLWMNPEPRAVQSLLLKLSPRQCVELYMYLV